METPDPPRRQIGRRRAVMAVALMIVAGILASFVWARNRTPMPVRSLLVLPFANLSMAADSEYFSDGLTDELIAAFSAVRGLRVVPRTTAFQFKGKSGDLRAIGRQLEADAVLDGGVRREGDRLRIHLSFTRVSDGSTMWSRTYDGKTQDVFATQQEIASNVLRTIFPDEQRAMDVPSLSGTKNVEAQNLFLKGKFISEKFDSSMEDALALFRRATDLDASYAQAWAGQAYCYSSLGRGYFRYPKDVLPLAAQAIGRALALNPRLALAHAIQGNINLTYLRDWQAAKRELEAAIELDPNNGEGHHWMSHYWVSVGRFKEAILESRRALEADPLNFLIGGHQAWVELQNATYSEAIRAAEATLRLAPHHDGTMVYLMRSYEESGQLREAIQVRRRMEWQGPIKDLEAALTKSGPPGYWRTIVEDLEANRKKRPVHPVLIATAYAHLGDRERTLSWLEKAVEERDPWAVYIKVEPWFSALLGDARFQHIVRTAGIP
jgi:TolB-like protein